MYKLNMFCVFDWVILVIVVGEIFLSFGENLGFDISCMIYFVLWFFFGFVDLLCIIFLDFILLFELFSKI